MNPRPRLRAAFALALLALLCLPVIALGHAELVESDPPDGRTIDEAPYTLIAEFDEELGAERSRIAVRDAAGNEVARGGVSEEDAQVMIVDLSGVAAGDYTAFWTAVTPTDNGVTRGEIRFTLVAPASPSPPPTASPAVAATGSRTLSATATATPAVSPTGTPLPSPAATDGLPAAGTTDLLVALVLASALIGLIVLFLWRRRTA